MGTSLRHNVLWSSYSHTHTHTGKLGLCIPLRVLGRCSEYQPVGSDALHLGSKDRYGSCMGGR